MKNRSWLISLLMVILSLVVTFMVTADIDVSGPLNLWPPPVLLFVGAYSALLFLAAVIWFLSRSRRLALSLVVAALLMVAYALYRDLTTPNSPEEALLTPRYQRYTLDVTFPARAAFYTAYGFGMLYLATGIILIQSSKAITQK